MLSKEFTTFLISVYITWQNTVLINKQNHYLREYYLLLLLCTVFATHSSLHNFTLYCTLYRLAAVKMDTMMHEDTCLAIALLR